jgi:hypothetical protein
MSLEIPSDAFFRASKCRIIGKLCASVGISENLDRLARVDKKTKIYIVLGRFLEKIHEAGDALKNTSDAFYRGKARNISQFSLTKRESIMPFWLWNLM